MMTIYWLLILKTFTCWCDCSIGMLLNTHFLLGSDNGIFEEISEFKKYFFCIHILHWSEILERQIVYISCFLSRKWHTLSWLIWWNSWNKLLVLYTCIIGNSYHTVFWQESSNSNGQHFPFISSKQTTTFISNLWT